MPRPLRRAELLRHLVELGGVAQGAELVRVSSWAALRACLADRTVVKLGEGMYALASVAGSRVVDVRSRAWSRWHEGPDDTELAVLATRHATARARSAALSHRCAAVAHGWPLWREPVTVELAVPHGRRVDARAGEQLVRRRLSATERHDHLTSPLRTVLDCARDLPWCESLAIADSALRAGAVGRMELREAGERYVGPAAARVRRVGEHADGRAANPFESALRAVLLDIAGFVPVPQFEIVDTGFFARVDLYDPHLGIVVEADSYEFHGSPKRFAEDRRRYTELQTRGHLVLAFVWADVSDNQEWVRQMVRAGILLRTRRAV